MLLISKTTNCGYNKSLNRTSLNGIRYKTMVCKGGGEKNKLIDKERERTSFNRRQLDSAVRIQE